MEFAKARLFCEFLTNLILKLATTIAVGGAIAKDGESQQMTIRGSGIPCEAGGIRVSTRFGMYVSVSRSFFHSFHHRSAFACHGKRCIKHIENPLFLQIGIAQEFDLRFSGESVVKTHATTIHDAQSFFVYSRFFK